MRRNRNAMTSQSARMRIRLLPTLAFAACLSLPGFVQAQTAPPAASTTLPAVSAPAAFAPAALTQNDTKNTAPHDLVRKDLAAFAVASVVADPSQQVWDSALAAIMALSDEERLALFT